MAKKRNSKRKMEKYKEHFSKILTLTTKGKTNKKHRKG